MLGDRFLIFLMPSTYNAFTPVIGPIAYVNLDSLVCQGEFPTGAGLSLTRSWDKPSESLLTRAVSTRKL